MVEQTLHHFLRDNLTQDRTLDHLMMEFETVWNKLKDEGGEWAVLKGSEETECKEIAKSILSNAYKTAGNEFLQKNPYYTSPTYRDLDRKFETMRHQISVTPQFYISGRPDRIDELDSGYEIIDYKTKDRDDSFSDQHGNLQLRMYGVVVNDFLKEKGLSKSVTQLRFLYLTPEITRSSTVFAFNNEVKKSTIEEVERLHSGITEYWNKYQTNQWPCLCGHCDQTLQRALDRAKIWAEATLPVVQTQLPTVQDIPF